MRNKFPCLGAWLFLLAACLIVAVGCTTKIDNKARQKATASVDEIVEDTGVNFFQAIGELQLVEKYNEEDSPPRIVYHLNRWLESQKPDNDWEVDPLYERLLPEFKRIWPVNRNLNRMEFDLRDVQFLRDTFFIFQTSSAAKKSELDARLAPWFAKQPDAIGAEQAQKLDEAQRMFDWIVRNLQLDELLPYAKAAAIGPVASGQRDRTMYLPPQRGDVGPGYSTTPGETLMFGHGDAWERSLLFILMCRQQGIDAVMLATLDRERPGQPRPWLSAVLIDDQLYLFDMELGLAIPGPNGEGIATLSQARDDAGVLAALNLDDERPYRRTKEDIEEIVALVEGTPFYLTQRMELMSRMLPEDYPMILSARPSDVGERVRKCSGVSTAKIWRAAYEALLFHETKSRLQVTDARRKELMENDVLFRQPAHVVFGRQQQLLWRFELPEPMIGAIAYFLNSRAPNSMINAITSDEQLREAIGMQQGDRQSKEHFRESLALQQQILRRSKANATIWLGTSTYEKRDFEIAIPWFRDRILKSAPDSPWVNSARYNLARCYEHAGDLQGARKLYFEDESPQSHGNVLRARMLRETSEPDDE